MSHPGARVAVKLDDVGWRLATVLQSDGELRWWVETDRGAEFSVPISRMRRVQVIHAGATFCACGCDGDVKEGRKFRPGHDAKLKSTLLAVARGDGMVESLGRLLTAEQYGKRHLGERGYAALLRGIYSRSYRRGA